MLWSSATRDDGTGWSRVRRRGGGRRPDSRLTARCRAGRAQELRRGPPGVPSRRADDPGRIPRRTGEGRLPGQVPGGANYLDGRGQDSLDREPEATLQQEPVAGPPGNREGAAGPRAVAPTTRPPGAPGASRRAARGSECHAPMTDAIANTQRVLCGIAAGKPTGEGPPPLRERSSSRISHAVETALAITRSARCTRTGTSRS